MNANPLSSLHYKLNMLPKGPTQSTLRNSPTSIHGLNGENPFLWATSVFMFLNEGLENIREFDPKAKSGFLFSAA